MASRGREVGAARPSRGGLDVHVNDELVAALTHHPTWSITMTEEGFVYSASSTRSPHGSDIGSDQIARLRKHIGKAFAGSDEQLLLRSRSDSGADQDLQVRLSPVHEDGAVRRVVGSTTVLSEVPVREGGAMDRLRLGQTVVESATDAIVVMDHEGGIVEFNPAAEAMFGYSRSEALSMQVANLMPRELASAHRRALQRHLGAAGSVVLDRRFETKALRADGSVMPIELTVKAVPGREPALFVGFMRDLTACRLTEEALVESELRLRAVADYVPDVIYHYRLRPQPGFDYVSPASARVLGYRPEEFLADPELWRRIVNPEDWSRILRALRGDPPVALLHLRCIRKDGTLIYCHMNNSVVRNEAGQVVSSVGVLRDDTERIRTHRELRDSAEQLRRVDAERLRLLRKLVEAHESERRSIASAIHDDSIQAVAALAIRVSAMRRRVSDPELDGSLAEIETSVSEAVNRLRRLMFDLHPTTLDRGGLAATVETHIAQLAGEGEPEFSLDNRLTREPDQRVKLALYRVIQEAITNARKHARAGNVSVRLSEVDREFVARIRDDGVGFAIEEIESPPGHLGLSTMREQAQMACGSLAIASSPGQGTTVEARIPIEQDSDCG